MILDYGDVRDAIEHGLFVAIVPGVQDGEPALVWLAGSPDRTARKYAYNRDPQLRAAQAIGVLMHVREVAMSRGFTPVE